MANLRASWYSQLPAFGWFDAEDKPGSNALGVPDYKQGIALPSRRTLGQWFNVTTPSGQTHRLQQTDIGPAGWTGRGVDISAAAAQQMGYTPKSFPTDASFNVEPADDSQMPANATLTSGNTNMANGLLDLYGLTPTDVRGGQQGGLSNMSNSLVGLGMGLLQPYNAYRGESPWTNALQGYQLGARTDQQARNDAMKLREAAYDRAFRQQEAQRAQSNADRSFGLQTQQFEQGVWQKVKDPETEQEYFYNPRTGQTMRPGGQAVAAPAAPAPFGGGVSYAGQGPLGVSPDAATGGAIAMASPAPAQRPPSGGFNLPPELQGAPPSIRREFQKKSAEELAKRTVQQQSAQKAREEKAQMIDPVGEDLDRAIAQTQQYPGMVAGWFGNLMKGIPSSQANDVRNLIETVKSSSSLEALQRLKEQSPTGSTGLGAVTQPEHRMLQNAIGSLEQSQTPEQFMYNLDRVRRMRQEIIHGPGTAAPPQFQTPAAQRGGGVEGGAPRPGFISKGYVFKGGDPSDKDSWAPVR